MHMHAMRKMYLAAMDQRFHISEMKVDVDWRGQSCQDSRETQAVWSNEKFCDDRFPVQALKNTRQHIENFLHSQRIP